MLLYFTLKSHTDPPLRYVPVIICKGRDKLGNTQIKCEKVSKKVDFMGIEAKYRTCF